jgi:hypothetical protein
VSVNQSVASQQSGRGATEPPPLGELIRAQPSSHLYGGSAIIRHFE